MSVHPFLLLGVCQHGLPGDPLPAGEGQRRQFEHGPRSLGSAHVGGAVGVESFDAGGWGAHRFAVAVMEVTMDNKLCSCRLSGCFYQLSVVPAGLVGKEGPDMALDSPEGGRRG